MSYVSEHNTEHKGEGNDGEDRWVHLLVTRHSVSVNDGLETLSELVGGDVGRGNFVCFEWRQEGRHLSSRAVLGAAQSDVDVLQGSGRNPSLGNQALATDIEVEQVHRVVDGLFLANLDEPGVEVGCDGRERLRSLLPRTL